MEIDVDGFLVQPNPNKVDLYLFMYKRDFGLCLKDYFTLTGYPPLIPKYALGLWWNRERIYNFNDTKTLVKMFKRNGIPLSVLLLSEFWHIKDKNNYINFAKYSENIKSIKNISRNEKSICRTTLQNIRWEGTGKHFFHIIK